MAKTIAPPALGPPATASSGSEASMTLTPHRMRISQGGKMGSYVSFALKHLQEHPDIPLELHTAPSTCSLASSSTATSSSTSKPPSGLAQSTLTTARLISVVEIIKREHGKLCPRSGLWQYNRSESGRRGKRRRVEQESDTATRAGSIKGIGNGKEKGKAGAAENEEDVDMDGPAMELVGQEGTIEGMCAEDQELRDLLSTKGSLHMSHEPYLVITLSARPINELAVQRNTTYQAVRPPKTAKRRKKSKGRTAGPATSAEGVEAMGTTVPAVDGRPAP